MGEHKMVGKVGAEFTAEFTDDEIRQLLTTVLTLLWGTELNAVRSDRIEAALVARKRKAKPR